MNHPDAPLVEALDVACPCTVRLKDGRALRVLNIAWGYDIGDEHAHVTTNVSPSDPSVEIDFFSTCEIEEVSDSPAGPIDGLHPAGVCSRCF